MTTAGRPVSDGKTIIILIFSFNLCKVLLFCMDKLYVFISLFLFIVMLRTSRRLYIYVNFRRYEVAGPKFIIKFKLELLDFDKLKLEHFPYLLLFLKCKQRSVLTKTSISPLLLIVAQRN